jgi:hypothetical protein
VRVQRSYVVGVAVVMVHWSYVAEAIVLQFMSLVVPIRASLP